jgi:magnesium chelatase subunit I
VSQRLSIRARELLLSAVERRCLLNPAEPRIPRLSDFEAIVPAVTGRIELVYEGEQEGPVIIAHKLIGRAMLKTFQRNFPPIYAKEDAPKRPVRPDDEEWELEDDERGRSRRRSRPDERQRIPSEYSEILSFFSGGGRVDLDDSMSSEEYRRALEQVPGLARLVEQHRGKLAPAERALTMEWVLEALHQVSLIAKQSLEGGRTRFTDMLANMFSGGA